MSKNSTHVTNARYEFSGTPPHSIHAALMFDHGSPRYHIWRDFKTGQFETTLYKNCALTINRGDYGHFDTRKLSPNTGPSSALIAAAMEQAGSYQDALSAWLKSEAKAKARETQKQEAAAALAHIKAHGPIMLDIVRDFISDYDNGLGPDIQRLRDAVTAAEGGAAW